MQLMNKEKKCVKVTLLQTPDMKLHVGDRLFVWGFSMSGPQLVCVGDVKQVEDE